MSSRVYNIIRLNDLFVFKLKLEQTHMCTLVIIRVRDVDGSNMACLLTSWHTPVSYRISVSITDVQN